jgi:mannose-1-phosphate guanylyltransferase
MLEAVLLVGGQGTRLRPLTLTTPKPMLPVAGVPFLSHQIANLREAGVYHVVLATSYQPEVFVDYFGDGSPVGVELTYVHEAEPLGTGGAIRNASSGLRSQPEDPVVVLNGDVFSRHDLAGQVSDHLRNNADVTLHLVEVDDARAYGCVPSDSVGRVTAFLEKMADPVTRWVNAGSYVFRRSVIESIPAGIVVSVERGTFPALLAEGANIRAYQENAYWLDVGTVEALVKCSADLVRDITTSSMSPGPGGESLVAEDALVSPLALIRGGSAVGSKVSVAQGADVDGSILMTGAKVGPGSVVRRSVIGNFATVGAGCVLIDCIVGDEADVPDGSTPAPGTRIEPGVGRSGDAAFTRSTER